MNVDVMVNGRPWKVAIEPAGQAGTFTVTIKGRSRVVDASWIDADTLSLIDAGAAREIRLHPRMSGEGASAPNNDAGAVGVEVGGKLYEAVVSPGDAKRGRQASAPGTGKAPPDPVSITVSIKSPMPGRVVRVLVAVGDRVTERQPLVVVEAMKMENEIRAPGEGVVKDVLVVPGAAVESGAVLVVVDQ